MNFASPFRRDEAWRPVALLLAYVTLGYSISNYATDASFVSLFWPGSGLAVGALLLGGYRYVPVVLIAELIGNLLTGYPLWFVVGITLVNTTEYSLICLALQRQRNFNPGLRAHSDYLRLVLTGAAIGLVSAACSSILLLKAGLVTPDTLVAGWLRWWQGDVMGIILVTPIVLVWKTLPTGWFTPQRRIETLGMLALTIIAGQIVFMGWLAPVFADHARAFMLFIFMTWAATRFGRHGLTLVVTIVMLQALIGGVLGLGYFADDVQLTGGQNIWLYMITFSLVGTTLVISVEQLRQTQDVLHHSRLRLLNLMQQSNRVREEERKHVAAEIHDEIGQTLTAIKLESVALKRKIQDEALRADLDHLAELADGSIRLVRNISTSLRPPALDLGLVPSISVVIEGFERNTGITCELRPACSTVDIPSYIATAAYRVVQESLTNVARHAGASRVVIDLRCEDNQMQVSIRDDGCGFDAAAAQPGLGLRGMAERAETVGGRFMLDSAPGRGTLVRVELPLKIE